MHCKKILVGVLVGSALLVTGCDKTVESHYYRMNIYPSLGKIQNAKVRVYDNDGHTLVAKGLTGTTGHLGLLPTGSGPAVIRVMAESETTYYDESLDGYVSIPAGQTLHALVPSRIGTYAVTPLTEIAYRLAIDLNLFPLTAREINRLNERVRAALAPELKSIINPVTILDALPVCSGDPATDTCLSDTEGNRYALRLMALARLGDGNATPMLSVMNALRDDVLDGDGDGSGIIDNLDKAGNSLNAPYDPNTMVDDMNGWLSALASSYGSAGLQAAVANDAEYPDMSLTLDLTNIDDGSNFSGCGGGDSTLPGEFKGASVNLTFDSADMTSPYRDGEARLFTFCSNGQLRVGSNYTVIANSFDTDVIDDMQTNYSWLQVSNNLLYEVVALDDTLYEVNVYGNAGAVYYGSFAP